MSLFGFMGMADDYEQRKVARYDGEHLQVSTAAVNDSDKPYETAVQHDDYDRNMIVVESYDTREAALEGHKRWVTRMTTEPLPEKLVENGESGIAQLARMGGEVAYPRKTA